MTDNGQSNQDQNPLRGVVLCCTSVPLEQRDVMATVAQSMGAVHKVDLTSDVTHLIVGTLNTPKYKYVARERPDIKVLRTEWLEAVRSSWIQGGDTDVPALEKEHAVLTLFGLQICVTGFDNVSERTHLRDIVLANGAQYHGDLTKAVTHLIAAKPEGKKYQYALSWGLKVVPLEWLKDSLARGMALEEECYDFRHPEEDRGKGAVSERFLVPAVNKRKFEPEQTAGQEEPGRRKLRRTTSTRLESQHDNLWADIGSGVQIAPESRQDSWIDESTVITRDFAKDSMRPKTGGQDSLDQQSNLDTSTAAGTGGSVGHVSSIPNLFDGQRFYVRGFDTRKTGILQAYMTSNGAEVLLGKQDVPFSEQVQLAVVVPYDATLNALEHLLGPGFDNKSGQLVTDWWVEKCIFSKSLVDRNHMLSRPILKRPIDGFEKLTICPTSFSGVELLHLSKAVKLLGGQYDETLRQDTSMLICNEQKPNPEKLKYALQHGIPVLNAKWLWETIHFGVLQDFEQFAIANTPKNPSRPGRSLERSETAPVNPVSRTSKILSDAERDATGRKEASQPLQELSTHQNSQENQRQSQLSESREAQSEQIQTEEQQFNEQDNANEQDKRQESKKDMVETLAHLKAQQRDRSRAQSSDAPTFRRRPLGRAPSNPSSLGTNRTLTSRPGSGNGPTAAEGDHNEDGEDREKAPSASAMQPSQALGYEDEESAAAREKIMARMGLDGNFDRGPGDQSRLQRVQGIGTVKDLDRKVTGMGGVEERVKKRLRR